MQLKIGTVVYSLAGHDKGDFQVIIAFDVELHKTSVKLVPVDVICENENSEE